mmetsp:Transcript_86270/g.225073  ORF Transcript_86270/g.225073 Transcript_86270/m.225073 type:complete len:210 (+) Transcript_86270:121-750(+)
MRPPATVTTRSQSGSSSSWWVTRSTAAPRCLKRSSRVSTVLVANSEGSDADTSSSSTTRGLRSRARAAQSSCRWPWESASLPAACPPPVVTSAPRPSSLQTPRRPTAWSASHISASAWRPFGSRFQRRLPSNRAGCWGTTPTMRERTSSPSREPSTSPHTEMLPVYGTSCITDKSSEDLPAPVRPMMAAASPSGKDSETPLSAGGRPSR